MSVSWEYFCFSLPFVIFQLPYMMVAFMRFLSLGFDCAPGESAAGDLVILMRRWYGRYQANLRCGYRRDSAVTFLMADRADGTMLGVFHEHQIRYDALEPTE